MLDYSWSTEKPDRTALFATQHSRQGAVPGSRAPLPSLRREWGSPRSWTRADAKPLTLAPMLTVASRRWRTPIPKGALRSAAWAGDHARSHRQRVTDTTRR